jgi:predicted Rossmann fold nucleotide-binding protein DprA/Smf involved in DNA uptake
MSACNQKPKREGDTMTTTQHTAGPWTYAYAPYTTQDGKELPAFEIHGEGEKVCDTVEDQPIEAQEANARLIVAAPELLDALQELVERERAEAAESGFTDDEMTWLEDARRVIAKAKGGAA